MPPVQAFRQRLHFRDFAAAGTPCLLPRRRTVGRRPWRTWSTRPVPPDGAWGTKNFRSCFHAHGNSGSATAVFNGKIVGSRFFRARKRFRVRAAGWDVFLNDRSRNQSQRFEPPRHEGHQESQTPTVNRVSALRVGLPLVLLVPWWLRIRFGRRGAVNVWSAGKRSPAGTKIRSPPVMGILFH